MPTRPRPWPRPRKRPKRFVAELYKQVPVLDSGARGSTITFAKQKRGDVLLAWENDAFWSQREFADAKLEIVAPSVSILAEPPVAVVDKVVDEQKTRDVAEAYLEYLYSARGPDDHRQELFSSHRREEDARPVGEAGALFTVDEVFGGWQTAQKEHFNDGGTFDQIMKR